MPNEPTDRQLEEEILRLGREQPFPPEERRRMLVNVIRNWQKLAADRGEKLKDMEGDPEKIADEIIAETEKKK